MSNQTLTSTNPSTSSSPRRSRRPAWIAVFLVVLIIFGVVVFSRLQRRHSAVLYAQAAGTSNPTASTALSTSAPGLVDLILPGNTEAVVVSDVYARASGYVKARYVDIGQHVRAGELLALIESPELDQDLARARATAEQARAAWLQAKADVTRSEEAVIESRARLEQSQANEAFASATAERWSRLVDKGVLPRQEGDEKHYAFNARKADVAASQASIRTAEASVKAAQASVVAAEANARANDANVTRLERMVAFERVTAPFEGVITERQVEQGDLITSGGLDGGRKLFAIAQPTTLRVKIRVPQTFAPELKEGQQAQLTVRERPGMLFTGTVARTANSLDASSRTLLTEVQVDNRAGDLLPGMFSEVKFAVNRTRQATIIPADALVANAQGTRVAVLNHDRKVHYQPVQVARDLGTLIEIGSGLAPGQSVVLNPGEGIAEGQQVDIVTAESAKN